MQVEEVPTHRSGHCDGGIRDRQRPGQLHEAGLWQGLHGTPCCLKDRQGGQLQVGGRGGQSPTRHHPHTRHRHLRKVVQGGIGGVRIGLRGTRLLNCEAERGVMEGGEGLRSLGQCSEKNKDGKRL
jgi:hypothetical protein